MSVTSPVPGYSVSFAFGIRRAHYAAGYHTGDDYAAPTGTPVVAVVGGRVRGPYWDSSYGTYLVLEGSNGRDYWYCHLSKATKTGSVKAGDVIGAVGATGKVTGAHLHFEDRPRGAGYGSVRKPSWPITQGTQAASSAGKSFTYVRTSNTPNMWRNENSPTQIVVHHWGEAKNYRNGASSGVVNHLRNSRTKVSAHFIATGKNGSSGPTVTQIAGMNDATWHAGDGMVNRTTISIEMHPMDSSTPASVREANLELLAELVALIWHWAPRTKDKKLRPHKDFFKTECPGEYQKYFSRVEARAKQLYPLVDPTKPGQRNAGEEDDMPYTPEEIQSFVAAGIHKWNTEVANAKIDGERGRLGRQYRDAYWAGPMDRAWEYIGNRILGRSGPTVQVALQSGYLHARNADSQIAALNGQLAGLTKAIQALGAGKNIDLTEVTEAARTGAHEGIKDLVTAMEAEVTLVLDTDKK